MKRTRKAVACHVIVAVGVMLAGICANGQTSEQISWETGLDQDLFATMQIDLHGVEVAVFFVYLNDRAFDSNISPGLADKLRPYSNVNALYVNVTVEGGRRQIAFDPTQFVILQFGSDPVSAVEEAWAEITPGFLGGFLQPNPEDPSYGAGSVGVLVLGESIDPEKSLTIAYSGQEQRAVTIAVGDRPPGFSGTGGAGEAATDPGYEDPRQGSLAGSPITIPFLSALLDEGVQAEHLAGLLGIPTSKVHLFACGGAADRVRILLVELSDVRLADQGAIAGEDQDAAALWDAVAPLAGTGAVMVWAASALGAEFTPYAFYLQQAGSTFLFFSRSSFVDLTDGFTQTHQLAPGEVSAGIVLVHRGIDLEQPYTMHYCGVSAQLGEGELGEDSPTP